MQAVDDSRLAHEVERAIGQLPGVDLGDLRVSVTNGLARIQGVVPSLADKQAAVEAAAQIPGITGVVEAIAVETPHVPRDPVLTEAFGEALEDEEEVDARRVGAAAVGGQASMVGTPQSLAELGRAAGTVEEVPGVSNSYDTTRIENPYGSDQTDLVNAIAQAFSRHPALRHLPIRALVEDRGQVVLVGRIHDESQRMEALRVASEVPGTHSIREELELVP